MVCISIFRKKSRQVVEIKSTLSKILGLDQALKRGEVAVSQNDFGFLVETFIRDCLLRNNDEEWLSKHLREWWPKIESYYRRHIIMHMEVAIALDEPPRYNRRELNNKEMWKKAIQDLRDPRSLFSIDYHCNKCKQRDVKLWRGVHGHSDSEGHELLCATCLAPGVVVDDKGTWQEPPYKDKSGKVLFDEGRRSDQVKGWLPAVPVDDTYWGYSSVPSQDLEWWLALATYPKV